MPASPSLSRRSTRRAAAPAAHRSVAPAKCSPSSSATAAMSPRLGGPWRRRYRLDRNRPRMSTPSASSPRSSSTSSWAPWTRQRRTARRVLTGGFGSLPWLGAGGPIPTRRDHAGARRRRTSPGRGSARHSPSARRSATRTPPSTPTSDSSTSSAQPAAPMRPTPTSAPPLELTPNAHRDGTSIPRGRRRPGPVRRLTRPGRRTGRGRRSPTPTRSPARTIECVCLRLLGDAQLSTGDARRGAGHVRAVGRSGRADSLSVSGPPRATRARPRPTTPSAGCVPPVATSPRPPRSDKRTGTRPRRRPALDQLANR